MYLSLCTRSFPVNIIKAFSSQIASLLVYELNDAKFLGFSSAPVDPTQVTVPFTLTPAIHQGFFPICTRELVASKVCSNGSINAFVVQPIGDMAIPGKIRFNHILSVAVDLDKQDAQMTHRFSVGLRGTYCIRIATTGSSTRSLLIYVHQICLDHLVVDVTVMNSYGLLPADFYPFMPV